MVQYLYYELPYHEKADLTLFLTLSGQAKTIVDIGANTGLFSVLASLSNPQASIYSFEPYRVNAGRMKDNLDLNGIRNVTVFEMAIGESDGEVDFAVPANEAITDVSSVNQDFSRSIYPDVKWGSSTVKVSRLDRMAQENGWKVDLIKCDVESFEMSVFKGADRILTEDRPAILFECFLDQERQTFFQRITRQVRLSCLLSVGTRYRSCSRGLCSHSARLELPDHSGKTDTDLHPSRKHRRTL